MKSAVHQYLKVRDVLIYLANSKQPKTIRDITDNVASISMANVRIMMNQLAAEGLVFNSSEAKGFHHRYYATEQTIELYGEPMEKPEKPKPRFINRGYGKEKLCIKCGEYYPCTEEYFYLRPPSQQNGLTITYEGMCIPCYNERKAIYRARSKAKKLTHKTHQTTQYTQD